MRKRVIDPITVQLSLDSYNDFFKVVKTIDLYRREPTFLFKEKKEKSGETIYRKKASLVERASQSSSRATPFNHGGESGDLRAGI